ncbi:hypothetical protein FQN49_004965 [Arthroderma sp. PD_2]|nr:hypothetical protein FQN49_004965 [Arthroderma sp. PD_2]
MWSFSLVTSSAGAALLCSVLTQYLSSRRVELCSEVLCWSILPVVFKVAGRPGGSKSSRAGPFSYPQAQSSSAASLWIAALGIVTFCLFKAETGMVGFFPALTPLLLVAQRYLGSSTRTSAESESWLFSPLANTVWGTSLAASIFIFVLSDWDFKGHALSAIPVLTLLGVYVTFMPKTDKSSRYLPSVDIEDAVRPLSLRVVLLLLIALGVEIATFGFPTGGILVTLILGQTKALSWYFIIQTVRSSSWCTAAATGTFSIISTLNPFIQSSEITALSHVIASFFALGQTIHILPKQAEAKSALWVFLLVSLGPYLANILAIHSAHSSQIIHHHQHPVEMLMRSDKGNFEDLLERQSRNYTAAHDEYKRRYSIEPPPGFEAWYEFAKSHQSPIIDEFDLIYDAISPFWRLSGKEVHEVMNRAQNMPDSELWLCTFYGSQAKTQCHHPSRGFDRHIQLLFNTLLKDIPGSLPDVKFLVNHLDEPRVVVPPPSPEVVSRGDTLFNLTNLSRRPAWDSITRFCRSGGRRNSQPSQGVETYSLPFVTDLSEHMDPCSHPEYAKMNGLTLSPTSFRLFEGLVPILSTGSPLAMGDILYPSPAYIESEFQYDDARDVEWDKKRNNLYWAGSTTGAFATNDHWKNYHRQRFVALAQNLETREHRYIREQGSVLGSIKSSFLNSRLYDVAFTKIFQCEMNYCREQRAYFPVKPWADKDKAFRSRLVFDIDGNAISGRYYKLLASKSAPLKQTVLREWHDERLMPWVHYIPVSQSMEELPELVSYLTSTESGRRRAKEIADQGRDWFSKAFRPVDMSIYTYRLLLELARLQDPDRPATKMG